MAVTQKVYVVTQVAGEKEEIVAVRLTNGAARSIAKLDGNRRVRLFLATKSHEPDTGSAEGGSHHDPRAFEFEQD